MHTVRIRCKEIYDSKAEKEPKSNRYNPNINEDIYNLREQGLTYEKIAEELKRQGIEITSHTVGRKCKEIYASKGEKEPELKLKGIISTEDLIKQMNEGKTLTSLAKEYGVDLSGISRRITRYYRKIGEEKPNLNRVVIPEIDLSIEEIIEKYESGKSQIELAKEYGVSFYTITSRVEEYYKKIGKEKPKVKKKNIKTRKKLPIEEIIEMYINGATLTEISENYGINSSTISKGIDEYYKEQNKTRPRIVKNPTFIAEYLNKGLSEEQIRNIALERNVIIPDDIMNQAIGLTQSDKVQEER